MHLGKEQSTGTVTDNEDVATAELPEATGSPERREAPAHTEQATPAAAG